MNQEKQSICYKGIRYKLLEKGEKLTNNRIYKVVRVKISKSIGNKLRNQILENILEQSGAIGCIEWWYRGSILYKPKFDFDLVLIFRQNVKYYEHVI